MNIKTSLKMTLLIAAGIMALGTALFAEDMAEKAAPPMMDEALMAKMQEFSTPNENHKFLDYFVGDWDYVSKLWMDPNAEPEVSSGTSDAHWIMNGRFVEQAFRGTMMGNPFNGRLTLGYDNLKKEYVSTWVDDMSTGIMTSTAQYDAATKTMTENGSHSCPIENGTRQFRAVTTISNDNTYTYEMFVTSKDGKEYKSMEICYSRKSV